MGSKKKGKGSATPSKSDSDIQQNPAVNSSINFPSSPEAPKSKSMTVAATTQIFAGPLPHPATLEQYDKVVHGAADRIISMAEKQAAHRQEIEKTVVKHESLVEILGQVFGFIIAILGFITGGFLIHEGHTAIGTVFSGGTIVALVSVFIYGKKKEGNKQNNKSA